MFVDLLARTSDSFMVSCCSSPIAGGRRFSAGQTRRLYPGTESRSAASPAFKDMFRIPDACHQPPKVAIVNLGYPPWALEFILRLIYPSPIPPAVDDLTIVSPTSKISG